MVRFKLANATFTLILFLGYLSSIQLLEGCSQSHIDLKGLCLPGQSVTIRDGTCKSTPELNLVASTYSPVNVLNCSKQRPLHSHTWAHTP